MALSFLLNGNLVAVWVCFVPVIGIKLIWQKKWKELGQCVLFFGGGFAAVTAVVLLVLCLLYTSTDCPIGGAASYIRDGENGLLVPVKDAEKMAEAMKRIAGDPKLAARLSHNAAKLREECPVDKVADRLLEIAGIRK